MIIRLLLIVLIVSYIFWWVSENVFDKKIPLIKVFIGVLVGATAISTFLYFLSELVS